MNINASPETIKAVADALKYAAFLDDRIAGADPARIAAWSEQVERHQLSRDDLMTGLQAFYDSPSTHAMGVGDLIHFGRIARRDRCEREADAERDRRRDEADAKVMDDVAQFTAAAITSRTKKKSARLVAAEEALQNCHGKRESQAALREYFAAQAPQRIPKGQAS